MFSKMAVLALTLILKLLKNYEVIYQLSSTLVVDIQQCNTNTLFCSWILAF